LSADNLFVFLLLFSHFSVPEEHQRRVLFWGIFGALVMRALLILAGIALVERFEWLFYVFGGFLVYTGVRLATSGERKVEPDRHPVIRLFRTIVPTTREFRGEKFLVREGGRLEATPLLVVLVAIESTDFVFALDSIPAIFSVTRDRFIVYTSNVFAILGLRSLYFVLIAAKARLRYLRPALAAILAFAGVKMLLHDQVEVPIVLSLGFIGITLAVAIVLSLRARDRKRDSGRQAA
jgi:tellurite resistance protein TerC